MKVPRKLKKKIPNGWYCYDDKGGACIFFYYNELNCWDCKLFKDDLNGKDGNIDLALDDMCKVCGIKLDY